MMRSLLLQGVFQNGKKLSKFWR